MHRPQFPLYFISNFKFSKVVCRQLLFKELRCSPERKVAQFLACWAALLAGAPKKRASALARPVRCFAVTWADLLRHRASLRTPPALFAALHEWVRRCLAEMEAQEGEEANRQEFVAMLEAIEGIGAIAGEL